MKCNTRSSDMNVYKYMYMKINVTEAAAMALVSDRWVRGWWVYVWYAKHHHFPSFWTVSEGGTSSRLISFSGMYHGDLPPLLWWLKFTLITSNSNSLIRNSRIPRNLTCRLPLARGSSVASKGLFPTSFKTYTLYVLECPYQMHSLDVQFQHWVPRGRASVPLGVVQK